MILRNGRTKGGDKVTHVGAHWALSRDAGNEEKTLLKLPLMQREEGAELICFLPNFTFPHLLPVPLHGRNRVH